MPRNKEYIVTVNVIDLKTQEVESTREVNFSKARGQAYLHNLIFSCINSGQGVTIALDKEIPAI